MESSLTRSRSGLLGFWKVLWVLIVWILTTLVAFRLVLQVDEELTLLVLEQKNWILLVNSCVETSGDVAELTADTMESVRSVMMDLTSVQVGLLKCRSLCTVQMKTSDTKCFRLAESFWKVGNPFLKAVALLARHDVFAHGLVFPVGSKLLLDFTSHSHALNRLETPRDVSGAFQFYSASFLHEYIYAGESWKRMRERENSYLPAVGDFSDLFFIPHVDAHLSECFSKLSTLSLVSRLKVKDSCRKIISYRRKVPLEPFFNYLNGLEMTSPPGESHAPAFASPSLILVVLTRDEELEVLDAVWSREIDSIFSEDNQMVLFSVTDALYDSGRLEDFWWFKTQAVVCVPRELTRGIDSGGVLEIIALAYSLSLSFHFLHVVVFPFDRVPLRIWSEIHAVTFDSKWQIIEIYGKDDEEKKWDYEFKEGVEPLQLSSYSQDLNPKVNRMFLVCNEAKTIHNTPLCQVSTAKSLSRSTLTSFFLQHKKQALSFIDSGVKKMALEGYSGEHIVGTFIQHMRTKQQWVVSPLFFFNRELKQVEDQFSKSSTALFSSLFLGSRLILPGTVISTQTLKVELAKLDQLRVDQLFEWEHLDMEQHRFEFCLQQVRRTGNLATHPVHIVNRKIVAKGEKEVHQARQMALGALNEQARLGNETQIANVEETSSSVVFVALIHKLDHVEMLLEMFVINQDSPLLNERVVVVPDKKAMASILFQKKLRTLELGANVRVLPLNLMIDGLWAAPSLVMKELVGFMFAVAMFSNFSHAMLISGDSVPLVPAKQMEQRLCPGVSYMEGFTFSTSSFEDMREPAEWRFQHVQWECEDRVIDIGKQSVVDMFPASYIKGGQWVTLSREHIVDYLLAQQGPEKELFDSSFDFFKLVHVPDEHWLHMLFSKAQAFGARVEFVSRMYTEWKGGFHPLSFTLNSIREKYQSLLDSNFVMLRKVDDLDQMVQVLAYVSDQWRNRSIEDHVPCPP